MIPPLQPQLVAFSAWHRHPTNRALHHLGIPLVSVAVLGALSRISVAGLDLGAWTLLGTVALDAWWCAPLAPGVVGAGALCWLLGRALPGAGLATAFVLGWGCQLAGHWIEGNRPAFADDRKHLVIGPRWLVNRHVRALPDDLPASPDLALARNDLLRAGLRALVRPAAGVATWAFNRRIRAFPATQARLRRDYGVTADTPIRGFDDVTRGQVAAFAATRPDVRFAETSGSTSAPKRLAYPPERLASFRADARSVGVRAWAAVGVRQPTIFVLSSLKNDASFTALAVWQDRAPGLITGVVEPARWLFHPILRPRLDRYGATAVRLWLMVVSDPGLIYSTNPSTLAVFLAEVHADWGRASAMIRDYVVGDPAARDAGTDRVLARVGAGDAWSRLSIAAAADTPPPIAALFPGLSAYCCWDGGYVVPFLRQIQAFLDPDRYAHIPMYAMSTETIETLTWFGPGGPRFLPLGPGVLVELLPEGAADDPTHLVLPAAARPGERYTLVVSDPWGLRRYQTDDVFVCVGRVGELPDLRFVGRRGLAWSWTGEKLTGEQVVAAFAAVHDGPLADAPAQLTVMPRWPEAAGLPGYRLVIAWPDRAAPALPLSAIAAAFDAHLSAQNAEYAEKRASGRLAAPDAVVLPYDAFAAALLGEGGEGARAWDSQFKLTPITRRRWEDVPGLSG